MIKKEYNSQSLAWAMFDHPNKKKFAEIILKELKTESKIL
jgi:hypothetical protein